MKCANCGRDAIYIYDPKPLAATAYCDRDLPSFLRPAARAGVLPTTDSFERVKSDALAKLSVTSLAPVEDEPETAETAEVETAPKPRRPRAKKAAAKPVSESTESS